MFRKLSILTAVLLIMVGITALLFAQVFGNLVPLSKGFLQRKSFSLHFGWIFITSGIVLYCLLSPFQIRRFLFVILGTAIGAWLCFGALIYGFQDTLLFSPRGLSEARRLRILEQYSHIEEITISTENDVVLHGWLIYATTSKPAPLILVFAGQGGEASRYLELSQKIPQCSWAFINYRGYGLSEGQPTEGALFQDAEVIFDYFTRHAAVDHERIFAFGGSLGTGVAVYLAAQRPLAGVILFSPYDKIGGGVAQDLIPLLPTRLLITNSFHVVPYASHAQAPALAIIGENDKVICPERSYQLMKHWSRSHELFLVPEGDHYSIYNDDQSWQAVSSFI